MTMTEYSTDMAVRFWDRQSGEERVEEVTSEQEAAATIARMLAWGTRAEVVTREHFTPPPWKVDRRAQERLDRAYVEETVELLAGEEIPLREACDRLRLIAAGLTHPADVMTARMAGGDVQDECQLVTWLERAANLHEECKDIRDGSVEKADTNDETLAADYENHLNVLANLVDHSGTEYGCTSCSVVAPAEKSEVAA